MTPSEKLILSRIKVLQLDLGMFWLQAQSESLGKDGQDLKKIAIHQ